MLRIFVIRSALNLAINDYELQKLARAQGFDVAGDRRATQDRIFAPVARW
jgi:hypothetical protein